MYRIAILAAGLVAVFAFATPTGARPEATKLVGTTGPGFTITLKKGGKLVKTLPHGKYTITVHNFRLKGPGLNKQITTLSQTGSKTVTVTLKAGRYTYQCDPHVLQGMKKTFRVT
jgi:Copper binding proteins, plastocyanin/azurin family